MFQTRLFIAVAVITLLFGLGFILIPDHLAASYGSGSLGDVARLFAQLSGSGLIAFSIIYFMARDAGPSTTLTGLLWAGLMTNIIDLVLIFVATTSGLVNFLGWVTVVLHIAIAVGFAYLLFGKPSTSATS